MKTEHKLKEHFTDTSTYEECENCGWRFYRKLQGVVTIITSKFYESEDYLKCDNKQ